MSTNNNNFKKKNDKGRGKAGAGEKMKDTIDDNENQISYAN